MIHVYSTDALSFSFKDDFAKRRRIFFFVFFKNKYEFLDMVAAFAKHEHL